VRTFTRDSLLPRLVFGDGALAQLGAEADRLTARRVMLVCEEHHADLLATAEAALGDRRIDTWHEVRQHVPVTLADRAIARATEPGADLVVTVRGGSAVGLGKAIALRSGLPVVAVPTTYTGSEMTQMWGMSEDGVTTTGRDPAVLPRTVVYDPKLLLGLPAKIVGPSGMKALAHCVEALYAPGADPLSSLLAIEGARLLSRWLPAGFGGQPGTGAPDPEARAELLWAACLAGHVLSTAGSSLHRALCHLLGGRHDLPHAETHAVVLPHVVAFVLPSCADALAPLAATLGVELPELADHLWEGPRGRQPARAARHRTGQGPDDRHCGCALPAGPAQPPPADHG
jgi:maleylacetate reductase